MKLNILPEILKLPFGTLFNSQIPQIMLFQLEPS